MKSLSLNALACPLVDDLYGFLQLSITFTSDVEGELRVESQAPPVYSRCGATMRSRSVNDDKK